MEKVTDTSNNSNFFKMVYELVAQIPPGRVASYGQIATLLGEPRAARTVGWAMHSIPDGLELPWHRVINAQGIITFNAHGQGAELQRALLESEGIVFNLKGRVDMSKYQWQPEEGEF